MARLLFVEHPKGATDLLLRYAELQRWFAGEPVYASYSHAAYPPASYMLLFPFIGWVGETAARWMRMMGLSEWTSLASLALFVALGVWIYRNRHADVWILLGVSAIIARIWTYHATYDDQLIFLAMIPILRWLRQEGIEERFKMPAACLLAIAWLAMFMPARTVYSPWPWNIPYNLGLPLIWGSMLILLVRLSKIRQGLRRIPANARMAYINDEKWHTI